MRKTFAVLLLALIDCMMPVFAYHFEADGIYYSIRSDAWDEVYVTFGDQTYSGEVVIPDTVTYEGATYSVTEIGTNAFRDCAELTAITFPSSLKIIGGYAFMGCAALYDVYIPGSVVSVDASSFKNTGWFNNQPDGLLYLDGWCLGLKGTTSFEELSIDEGTFGLADNAFYENTTLVSVALPNSLVRVGYFSFYYCSQLRHVDFGTSVEEIGSNAFKYCVSLDSVHLPESVTKIETWAFTYCSSLSDLVLPNSITTIEGCAFVGCSSLQHVDLPNSLTEIGYDVFEGAGLKSIVIPEGVVSIGNLAFFGCDSLSSVVFSQTVAEIGYAAFSDCGSLATVTCLGSIPASLDRDGMYNDVTSFDIWNTAVLVVPCGCADVYRDSDWGEVFGTIIEDCEGIDETVGLVSVFPNPAQAFVQVEGVEVEQIEVYNALGQLEKNMQNANIIDISDLPEGVYLLRIRDAEGKSHATRVMVSR